MPAVLTDLSPQAIVTATKDNLYEFFREFRRSSICETSDTGDSYLWHTPVPHPWFNGVLALRKPADGLAQAVASATQWMRRHNAPNFTWWLGSNLDSEDWRAGMTDLGLRYDDSTPGMAVQLEHFAGPERSGLLIERVASEALLMRWADTFVRGFEMPGTVELSLFELMASLGLELPFRHYLGFADGKPVAASTLYLGAGVAGVYFVATIAAARGRGYGRAMTLLPLIEARDLGYRLGVLQSSDQGRSVYERLGFVTQCQMDHFFWQA